MLFIIGFDMSMPSTRAHNVSKKLKKIDMKYCRVDWVDMTEIIYVIEYQSFIYFDKIFIN